MLQRREKGERDLSLLLLLDTGAVVHAIAPSALGSSRRFGGGLGPFQRYRVRFDARRRRATYGVLVEAAVERGWSGVLLDLRRTAAAGVASTLLREAGTYHDQDPWAYVEYERLLDGLEGADWQRSGALLLRFSLAWCEHEGHPLVLDACVRCERRAPEHSSVRLEPGEGGVLCRDCGQGSVLLRALERAALTAVLRGDDAHFSVGMLRFLERVLGVYAPQAAEALAGARAHWSAMDMRK